MSYGSTVEIGPDALVLAFEEMLKAHLASTVAAIETAWGLTAGTIRVPDTIQGYALSRKYGNDSAPSIRIYLDRNWLADQPRFPGAGAAWAWSIVRVRVRAYADMDIGSERQVSVLCEAVGRVISKYFTAWHDKMLAAKCERVTDWRGPSLRERGQSEGFSYYGRDDRNTDEEADLTWEIYHRQAWDVSYSKDLPPTP
jgi:hypothetical protein